MQFYDLSQTSLAKSGSSIVEEYIPLWFSDGTNVQGVAGVTTSGSNFVQDGSTSTATSISGTQTKLFTLNSTWLTNQKFAFEATIWTTAGSNGTVYAAMWDTTLNIIVSASQVSNSLGGTVVVRSGQFTLIPSHSYGITIWQTTNQYADLVDASLIVFGQ